jgi:NTP pyrophosphatase (non-canonical NTP hydrolase)
MTISGYKAAAAKFRYWHKETALGPGYAALALAGEAGEVANEAKRLFTGTPIEGVKAAVEEELGDVMWYFTILTECLGINPEELLQKSIRKMQGRSETDGLGSIQDR